MQTTGITMAELDGEVAEYLPAREVMWSYCGSRKQEGPNQSNVAVVGSNDGNTYQEQNGFINVGNISLLNGSFDGNGNEVGQSNYS